MADYSKYIPFVLQAEGGLSCNKNDEAAKNPCPFEYLGISGYHTNKGITWAVFSAEFGDTQAAANRFFAMDTADWGIIFKKNYWDKILGDDILSLPIAYQIIDWVWMSGQHFPEIDIQKLINTVFNKHLAEDGVFGPGTIEAINSCDQALEYTDIMNRRKQYYEYIVSFSNSKGDHSQDEFLKGWLARVVRLDAYISHLSA